MTKKMEHMDNDNKEKLIDMALMQVKLPDDTTFFKEVMSWSKTRTDVVDLVKGIVNIYNFEEENVFIKAAEMYLLAACIFYLKENCDNKKNETFSFVTAMIDVYNCTPISFNLIFDNVPTKDAAYGYYRALKQLIVDNNVRTKVALLCKTKVNMFYLLGTGAFEFELNVNNKVLDNIDFGPKTNNQKERRKEK